MNNYARLPDVQALMQGLSGSAATTVAGIYLREIERESRKFDDMCGGLYFYSRKATRYYTGDGTADLLLPEHLVSVDTLTENGVTLTQGTDFVLNPEDAGDRGRPYWKIRRLNGVWSSVERDITVTGLFGWPLETDATGLTGDLTNGTDTSLSASGDASSLVYAGDTLVLGDEQMYVTAVATTTITVVRGINGTTAAAHSAEAILLRRFPADIEQAISRRVVAGRWGNNAGAPFGLETRTVDLSYARYMDAVRAYRWVPL